MRQQPLVSVLMPVYNGQEYLAEAIQSIIRQTYSNWELLILNDASTDNSKEIALSFSDSRIRYEENAENLGIVKTRNKLFEFAKGDFFAILDCDDVAHPERIFHQISYMMDNANCILCGSWAMKIDAEGREIGKMQPPVEDKAIRVNQLFQSSFVQSSVLLRAKAMRGVSYSEDYPVAEDFDLWKRLLEKGKGYNLPKYLIRYRWYAQNTSSIKEELMREKRNAILARQLKSLGDFAEQEVAVMAAIGSLQRQEDASFFTEAPALLRKLFACNKAEKKYDCSTFQAMLSYRWIFYCAATKQYRAAVKYLPFFFRIKSWQILLKHLYRKAIM